ncbi:hypothetical protein [Gelatiniphilus marinus]|uniref:Uncharacterized protein n=1 Tax=Gelatiniphilus marinus TaxID=1759464 RepID=A0ABW5JLU9_9FLAO
MPELTKINEDENKEHPIYLSIDHLKDGHYKLNITLKSKVIKSIKLNKNIESQKHIKTLLINSEKGITKTIVGVVSFLFKNLLSS